MQSKSLVVSEITPYLQYSALHLTSSILFKCLSSYDVNYNG